RPWNTRPIMAQARHPTEIGLLQSSLRFRVVPTSVQWSFARRPWRRNSRRGKMFAFFGLGPQEILVLLLLGGCALIVPLAIVLIVVLVVNQKKPPEGPAV